MPLQIPGRRVCALGKYTIISAHCSLSCFSHSDNGKMTESGPEQYIHQNSALLCPSAPPPSSLLLPPTLILGLREYSYDIEKRPRRTPKPKRAAKDVPSNRLSTYSIRSLVNSCTVLCIGNHCHSNRVGYQIRYTYRLFSTFAFCE